MTQPISFNAKELGQLVIRLQRVCAKCAEAHPCPGREACPVEIARNSIGQYLFSGQQVDRAANLAKLPRKPVGATYDEQQLADALASVPTLCNRCMFHVDSCFLNVLYTCLELALGRTPKEPGQRPAEMRR
ncbi:MAG TPA: hypothetical protein VGK67_06460 [Myxococcales bacterium]|jgi:hypothetical protein